mmetsp:Transcript_32016/g.57326  ORF Transcript_32016/g.57326 Transcript_32016/m.57326 type:complete len:344 (+) Transcript_32016:1776-2807(+)
MRRHVHFPVGDEEFGGRDLTLAGALPGDGEHGTSGHPNGVQVGDGAAGADVAADAGGVADLCACKPVQLVDDRLAGGGLVRGPAGNEFLAGGHERGEGGGGAKGDALLAHFHRIELSHMRGAHQHGVPRRLELHFDAHLAVAHDQLGVGVFGLDGQQGGEAGGAHPGRNRAWNDQLLGGPFLELARENGFPLHLPQLGGPNIAGGCLHIGGAVALGGATVAGAAGGGADLAPAVPSGRRTIAVTVAVAIRSVTISICRDPVATVFRGSDGLLSVCTRIRLGEYAEGVENGTVPSATAEVAAKAGFNVRLSDGFPLLPVCTQQRIHRHHKPRRAESALGAVRLG